MGTPQGGLISPILANVFLHFVLDLWFQVRFLKTCNGKGFLVRYADDFVALFSHKSDAERFFEEAQLRLNEFGLEAEPSKTKLMKFGVNEKLKRGERAFTFLGFTHVIGKSRNGFPILKRFSDGKRMKRKLKDVYQKLKKLRNKGMEMMLQYTKNHLTGYMQYYGISGNLRRLSAHFQSVKQNLFKMLNRRSQKKSLTEAVFHKILMEAKFPNPAVVVNFFSFPEWRGDGKQRRNIKYTS